ncbi:hypothetical protein FOZ62_011814, partial [Perkinsus olseni]
SEEVEVWLTEFRNLRERLAASMDEEEEARKRVIFRAPGASTSSPTVWSSACFAEMGPPTEDVVAEIDSAAAVVALETVAKGIEKTARVSRRSRHKGCRSAPEGRGSDLTFVQWCVWCYALMLRIQHPLTASTASDMQSGRVCRSLVTAHPVVRRRRQAPATGSGLSFGDVFKILASLQRYVLCPQPLPCEGPPEYNEWAVRHGRL